MLVAISVALWLAISITEAEAARISHQFGTNTFTVTRLECFEHDSSFLRFAYCHLKPINRTTKIVAGRILVLQPPLDQGTVHITTFKRANGYKPFIINVSLDACRYLGGKRNPIVNWAFDVIKLYSNINHSCPFVDDIVVENLPVNKMVLPSLFPEGDYRVNVRGDVHGIPRLSGAIYVTIKEN